jgi:hypothetical protein
MNILLNNGNTSVRINFKHLNGEFNKKTNQFEPFKIRTTVVTTHVVDKITGKETHYSATSGRLFHKDTFNKRLGRYRAFKKLMFDLNVKKVFTKEERRFLWKQFFATSPSWENIFNKIGATNHSNTPKMVIAL